MSLSTPVLDRKAPSPVLQYVRLRTGLKGEDGKPYLDLRAMTLQREAARTFQLLLIGKVSHQLFTLVQQT